MKILITGSSGFLGSNLIKNIDCEIITYDLKDDPNEVLENINLLKQKLKSVDLVYHLAGISDPNSADLYKVNVSGTYNLKNTISELNQDTRIIFASTFGVYKIPKKGDIIDEKYSIDPRNEYGKSKLLAENAILENNQNIVMRLSNVYGPNMLSGKHSVITNFIESILSNNPVNIYDRNASRDFIYIDDLTKVLVKAHESKKGGIFNICSGQETNVLDLIYMIEKITKKKAKLNFLNQQQNSGNWKGSFKKAEKNFDWKPVVKIEKGLRKTIESFL